MELKWLNIFIISQKKNGMPLQFMKSNSKNFCISTLVVYIFTKLFSDFYRENKMSQTEEKLENNADKILAEAVRKSEMIEKDIAVNPKKYRVLTGDRPTGA